MDDFVDPESVMDSVYRDGNLRHGGSKKIHLEPCSEAKLKEHLKLTDSLWKAIDKLLKGHPRPPKIIFDDVCTRVFQLHFLSVNFSFDFCVQSDPENSVRAGKLSCYCTKLNQN